MAQAIKRYLGNNDIRNKVTNETIQGMRVVKFSGLENVFIDRIKQTRLPQCWDSLCIDPACNCILLPSYILSKNISQKDFPVLIMPNLSFLNQMRRECRAIPMYIQAVMMIIVGLKRVQDFILLPELKRESYKCPDDSENVALTIENGYFAWGDPIQIPLTVAEREQMQKEMQ
ncbi:MAG: hypothetical protein EZS28_031746, partial [Streblomastix strix]